MGDRRGTYRVLAGRPDRKRQLGRPRFVSEDNIKNGSIRFEVTEGKIKGELEVTRRRGRKRKKLLDELKDRRGYSHLKEEAPDRTMWRNRFGRGVGPVVRQNIE
jgi:hypothetical protein